MRDALAVDSTKSKVDSGVEFDLQFGLGWTPAWFFSPRAGFVVTLAPNDDGVAALPSRR
jgi:hypothetical protein